MPVADLQIYDMPHHLARTVSVQSWSARKRCYCSQLLHPPLAPQKVNWQSLKSAGRIQIPTWRRARSSRLESLRLSKRSVGDNDSFLLSDPVFPIMVP